MQKEIGVRKFAKEYMLTTFDIDDQTVGLQPTVSQCSAICWNRQYLLLMRMDRLTNLRPLPNYSQNFVRSHES